MINNPKTKFLALFKLLRPKHYLKNFLIFLPLLFGGYVFDLSYLIKAIYSFAAFSMLASAVYIINDIKDRDYDVLHHKKKERPIAAGLVTIKEAISLIFFLLLLTVLFQYLAGMNLISCALLATYLGINIAYSFGLKNLPIIDITLLSLGFVIRVLYGGYSVGVHVSKWLYLAVLAFSFYLSLGKRRNEILSEGSHTRKVSRYYDSVFLDKYMHIFLGLTLVYYSLWTINPPQKQKALYYTIPLVIMITMTYSLDVEKANSDGDPVNVLFANKLLLALVLGYGAIITLLVYLA